MCRIYRLMRGELASAGVVSMVSVLELPVDVRVSH